MGLKVVYPEKMPDKRAGGMNCKAARDPRWNLPYPYPCSTILIDPNQSCEAIHDTARHEYIELSLMTETKLPYRKAHALTEKIEKATK